MGNANLPVLLPIDSGVSLKVGEETKALTAETVTAVDHYTALSLQATEAASVLTAQVWHPEIATIERTTEVRERASNWGLKDDEVKKLTADINAHGKKGWEKVMKKWMAGPVVGRLQDKLEAAETAARQAKQAAEKEAEEKARNEDEDRKKGLEALEKKRQAKKEQAELAEKKRIENKKRLEAERAKKRPMVSGPCGSRGREEA